jgi:hypothetical protein
MRSDGPDETTYFRYVRTLDGSLEPVDLIRHNGRSVPRFSGPKREAPRPQLLGLYRELMYNLSRLERRTWVPLLLGRSFEEVAATHGISRAAIYARLRGNSKGQGGMVRKNEYVAIWWRLQRKRLTPKTHA